MSDNADNKFAEIIRDRLVQQLTVANEQLEQFAYVASHDLREPLRIIVCFTDLLLQEYGQQLAPEAVRYMEINRKAAKKMEAMVSDLLEYGRLNQSAERMTEIDCNDILQQAVEALGESIRSTQAIIQSSDLPKIATNPLRLSRVFQNLVGNALKYQPVDQAPVIRIAAEDMGDRWQFSVTDNGIGIAPEYLELIFAPFKRLHDETQYTGSGIGLAICKRIIEGFGGDIWAESHPGRGCTFFFTLPKRESDPTATTPIKQI